MNFCLSLCEEKMKLSIWENIRLIFQQKCCTKNRPMFSFSFSIQDKKLLFDSISTKHLKETLIKIRIITRVSFNCFLGGLYNLLHYLTRHHITNVSINYIFCNVNLKLKSWSKRPIVILCLDQGRGKKRHIRKNLETHKLQRWKEKVTFHFLFPAFN